MADAKNHNVVREGILTGMIGATAIAVWFLVVDTLSGSPFYTPQLLGRGLLRILGPAMPDTALMEILSYTVFHYAAFAIFGIVIVAIIHQSHRTPAILAGLLILFVVFQLGFYGLAALLSSQSPLGGLAWYQIFLSNLVAVAVMGRFMLTRHPALKADFTSALEGTDEP